jgi:hypothetical protein
VGAIVWVLSGALRKSIYGLLREKGGQTPFMSYFSFPIIRSLDCQLYLHVLSHLGPSS